MKLNQEQMLATAEQFGIARGWIERGVVMLSRAFDDSSILELAKQVKTESK